MRILALDTATAACSVALNVDGKIVARRFDAMARGQAEALAPMVEAVLQEASMDAAALDLLAVTVGPGAFTGLRIGLATARALSLATAVPCLGLTTTEVIAAGVAPEQWPAAPLLVALDSKRTDFYVQTFAAGPEAIRDAEAVEPERLSGWLGDVEKPLGVVGDARDAALAVLAGENVAAFAIDANPFPDAACMTHLAARRWLPGGVLATPSPLYLRPPDAKLPRNGGRLRP